MWKCPMLHSELLISKSIGMLLFHTQNSLDILCGVKTLQLVKYSIHHFEQILWSCFSLYACVSLCFFVFKNGNRRNKYLVLGHEESYFVKEHSDSKQKYSEDDIIKMLEFLVDNIFVVFAGKVFQQIVGIPMGTNCAPLLADIFLYSYEAEFIQSLLSTGRKQLASRFNFTYRYIDDVLSINNPEFENYLGQMYPVELEIKDTTESNISASYLDLLLSIWRDGQLHISIYDKRDDFNFHITNFPFLSSNIPTSPAYDVFISQLIRYARVCPSYECFILRATRVSNKLLEQGYVKERLKSSLRKFYRRYGDLIKQYEVSLSQMLNDILWPDHIQWQHPTDQTLYRTRPFTEFLVVSIEYFRRMWHADRGRLLIRTPGPVPFGTCICSTCWDQRLPISIRHYTSFWHYYRT